MIFAQKFRDVHLNLDDDEQYRLGTLWKALLYWKEVRCPEHLFITNSVCRFSHYVPIL